MTHRTRRAARSNRGQALVELALVSPVLLGLLCAVLHLGTLLFFQIQLDTAIRSAGLFASYHPELDESIAEALRSSVPQFVARDSVTLEVTTPGTRSQGDPLVLRARCVIPFLEALPTRTIFGLPTVVAAEGTICILAQSGQ